MTVTDPSMQSRAEFGTVQNPRDREVLALAFEVGPDALVTGDEAMAREAATRNLPVLTVLELLLAARQAGALPALRPVLDRMTARDFGIPPEARERALSQAGES